MVWIRSLLILKSLYNSSLRPAFISGVSSEVSISPTFTPISGKTKKLSLAVLSDKCAIPLSVKSIWLFFSSITNHNASSTSGINLLLSAM